MHNSYHDILFEPLSIGPKTTRNRFYQVPHCTGMGYRYPRAEAHLRGIKAEGGWGVVSTQETEIHPTSDISPANEARLWDESDIPALQLMTEAVHEHGSLAAIQLVHNGLHAANRYSRQIPLAPSAVAVDNDDPVQARAMSRADINQFRQWHRDAALRARRAGFDIIYVYAGHDMTLLQHFLLQRHNQRSDEYGGSFENRLRLFREVLADTKDAVGDTCAIAVRLAVEELMGEDGIRHDAEGRDIIEALAEEPDLWDVNLSDWSNDSQSSRFAEEGYQEPYTAFVKSLTSKPVVGVGRYTSPDTMARLLRQGHLDLIGAARPSIADPFLPLKIEQGRTEEIRECIGCNICVSGDNTCVPMRCTQNPTIGEEWRRGWHPEIIAAASAPKRYLIIGGGPAGLESACALSEAGHDIIIADKSDEWGGRVSTESRLPGLAQWVRVRDSRLWRLQQRANVTMVLRSDVQAEDILDYGISNVVLATGARWRDDGCGRTHRRALAKLDKARTFTPDSVLSGRLDLTQDTGPLLIYDDDRFYLGGVLAEWAVKQGRPVTLVTPSPIVSPWSENTLEQVRIQKRLLQLGVKLLTGHRFASMDEHSVVVECVYSANPQTLACSALLLVTARLPNDQLWHALHEQRDKWTASGLETLTRIGDCLSPGLIAAAVYSGHEFARSQGADGDRQVSREDHDGQLSGRKSAS